MTLENIRGGSNPPGSATTNSPEFEPLVKQVKSLSVYKLKKLRKICGEEIAKKTTQRRGFKYGNKYRAFTDTEFKALLACTYNQKARFLFWLMSQTGFRIGEALKIQVNDIDFKDNTIRVQNEKDVGLITYQPLKATAMDAIRKYLERFQSDLQKNPYLFSHPQKKTHWSSTVARRYFSKARDLAHLNEVYDFADDTRNPNVSENRALYRLCLHSIRKYYGTTIWKKTKDLLKTSRLLRHKKTETSLVYLNISSQELKNTSRFAPDVKP